MEDIKEHIDELISRFLTGNASQNEASELIEWLELSEENRNYFEQHRNIWLASGLTYKNIVFDRQKIWNKLGTRIEKSQSRESERKYFDFKVKPLIYNVLKIAAIFLIAFLLGFLVKSLTDNTLAESTTTYYEITSPLGSKSKIKLPDGSNVWLNSGSLLKFPLKFNEKDRQVLLSGEAYFDIKKDERKPFFVNTSNIRIKVLGTAFNIKAYADENQIETTLERGLICLENKNRQITLKPDQQALTSKNDTMVTILDKVSVDYFTAWKDENLLFENETFESLAIRLERWYKVKIYFNDNQIKKVKFTGKFKNENITQVLDALKFAYPFNYVMKKDEITIINKKGK